MYDIRVAIKNDFDAGRNDVLQLEKTTIVNRLVHYNMTFFTGTTLPFESAPRLWVNSLEQCLMFILILARWLLPKGDVVKDYIPLLLMVFLGMAADIIQFFDVFKEPPLRYHEGIVYLILVLITVSLIPFILVPTVASRSTPMEPKYGQTGQKPAEGETTTSKGCGPKACQSAEVLGILATLFLQNGLTIGILLYRLGIVYIEGNKKKDYSEIDDPGDMGY
ncbi:uncharacterized protein LOC141915519 [Tubulanus polymorphus]|uniref:uncharacterized protein LOC141915519 n=1 Tax=Tubulanus polymorphus TaxID=672921 RepID=UPI003DA38D44